MRNVEWQTRPGFEPTELSGLHNRTGLTVTHVNWIIKKKPHIRLVWYWYKHVLGLM